MARLILHIDDDSRLPEGVAEALAAEGYAWRRTADPETAMRVVQEQAPCLVLMEIDLAGCDGLDLLAGIRAAGEGETPVLILTRLARDSGMHGEAIALGATHFLTKPVLASELLSDIRELAPPPPRPAPEAPAPPGPGAADLSGELSDTPVPELLARLRRRGASGVLKLQRGEARIGIDLRNGSPTSVGTNWRVAIRGAAQDEAEAALFESFGWSDGSFAFLAGRRLRADTTQELLRDPAVLLLEGVQHASPAAQVRERLRKRSTLYVSPLDADEEPLDGLELTRQQTRILEELAGQDSLGDLLASNAFEERSLYGLWVAGRIELHAVPTLDLVDLYGEDSGLFDEPGPTPERTSRPASSRKPTRADTAGDAREELSQTLRELAQRVMTGDDFETLGLPVDASDDRVHEAYQRALRELPRQALDASDAELRGRAERIRDRIEAAYAHLKDPESRRAYALLRNEERQDRDAGLAAERALEGERWFRKGRGHLERRRHEEAAEAFGMASHLVPKEGEYRAHLGYALFLARPDDKVVQREAMEHIANGIKSSPDRELSHVYLGRILKARGEHQAALKLFKRALRIKPNFHPALQEIRLLEMRSRKGKGLLSRLLGG